MPQPRRAPGAPPQPARTFVAYVDNIGSELLVKEIPRRDNFPVERVNQAPQGSVGFFYFEATDGSDERRNISETYSIDNS
jgi:hypothetical protein